MHDAFSTIWSTLAQEFSDVGDMADATRIAVRLLMAVLLGGLIGYEREQRRKAAGLRTHTLVALGAAVFVLAPLESGMEVADLSRVMQGVVAGIGFLGAGAIIKLDQEGIIKGLTTAASIWMAAAIGVTVALGREVTAIMATVLALFILIVLRWIESKHPGRDR
ncbi:MgtC/SapB family protein [Pusillimonas sp.]|uniref:MgtC/SapB family protein n=1 Tax=Pusillimonas sp. TaxID=3040095 RepID=UPI0037C9072B